MRFIVVGLGSMGKRRIRCLKTLGYDVKDIVGFDLREDRRNEVEEKYGVKSYSNIGDALEFEKPSVMIISVPPAAHHLYMKIAIEKGIHFFVEASVVDTDMDNIKKKLKNLNIVAAPSSTAIFHPAVRFIQRQLEAGVLGKISNIVYHVGQYLPDWHTYEPVSDFYVSNPATGGAREIVPFELTWLTEIFGFPKRVCGNLRKTIDIKGAERIDDTYNFLLDYGDFLASITVDVVSRCPVRRLLINGEKRQLFWNWDDDCVKLFDPLTQKWKELSYEIKATEAGYHSKIAENMYVDELKSFIDAVEEKGEFINNLEKDHQVLKLLYAIEESDKKSKFINMLKGEKKCKIAV